MWITFDPRLSFPQTPRPGRGIVRPDGRHTPPNGLASFEVDEKTLIHGARNREIEAFYQVTGTGVLTPLDQASVDAIRAQWQSQRQARERRRPEAAQKVRQLSALIKLTDTQETAREFMREQVLDANGDLIPDKVAERMGDLMYVMGQMARHEFSNTDDFFE